MTLILMNWQGDHEMKKGSLRDVYPREVGAIRKLIIDKGIDQAVIETGLSEYTLWSIDRKGTKHRVVSKTSNALRDYMMRAGYYKTHDEGRPEAEERPQGVANGVDAPPIIASMVKAIRDGISDGGGVSVLEKLGEISDKLDRLTDLQLKSMASWGIRETGDH